MEKKLDNIDPALLEQDDRIALFLKGKMTPQEEQVFMQELKNNPELKARAVALARLVKGMKEVGRIQDEDVIGAILAADENDVKSLARNATTRKVNVVPMRTMAKWLSMAASILLVVWLGIGYHDYRTTTGLGEEYGTMFSTSQLTRGAGEPSEVDTRLAQLFDNVANKNDLDNTLHELSLCWELSTQEAYNDYTDYAPEIGWNLAIGYLKDNNRKQAKATLEKLTEVVPEGTAIGEKARELNTRIH
jgi:hypothetical protein